MFYEYQKPNKRDRLVGWWASGRLDSWLISQLPTRNPGETCPVTGLPGGATLCVAESLLGFHLFPQSHQCASVSGLCPSSHCSLPRRHPEAMVGAPVTGTSSWQNYFLCAELPLVSKHTGPRWGAGGQGGHKSLWLSLPAWLLTA